MWESIERPWKIAFELGWDALKHGSIPIGAVLADENGNIISQGRNRLYEKNAKNPKIAHAETETLQNLDVTRFPNVREYTLYTCMEPCPMCMGTIVMSNLRKLRVASRDSYCGAVHYCKDDPYISSKDIQVIFEGSVLETVQLTLQTYFELSMGNGEMNRVTSLFERDNPVAVKIAKAFYECAYIKDSIKNEVPFSEVFNQISARSEKALSPL